MVSAGFTRLCLFLPESHQSLREISGATHPSSSLQGFCRKVMEGISTEQMKWSKPVV